LNIYEHSGPPCVSIHNDSILEMYVRPGSDRKKRINILEEWYRLQLKEQIPHLISRWESVMGVSVKEWGVKKMKTRWGSCNIKSQRIWLNLELAKRPQQCLEYIVVHEMIHLLERYHNTRFYRLMDAYMPEWRDYFYILNKTSLLNTMRLY
jgi:predicted metal-dependent hydrolase